MIQGLIGKKIGMTQLFDQESLMVVVTLVEAGPCYVVSRKTVQSDGYEALQLGFGKGKPQRFSKPMSGHFKKSKVPPLKVLKEFKAENVEDYQPGQEIKADIFSSGDILDITGVSKGKGFSGTMKRYGFRGGPSSHGGMAHRRPGSIGQASYPGRVFKGIKMAGRMGGRNTTVRGVRVVSVDPDKNLIAVRGSLPGPDGGTLLLKLVSRNGDK